MWSIRKNLDLDFSQWCLILSCHKPFLNIYNTAIPWQAFFEQHMRNRRNCKSMTFAGYADDVEVETYEQTENSCNSCHSCWRSGSSWPPSRPWPPPWTPTPFSAWTRSLPGKAKKYTIFCHVCYTMPEELQAILVNTFPLRKRDILFIALDTALHDNFED